MNINLSNWKFIVIPFVITTCFFYFEALIHYNLGRFGKVSFSLPPLKKNLVILGIIIFFSSFLLSLPFVVKSLFLYNFLIIYYIIMIIKTIMKNLISIFVIFGFLLIAYEIIISYKNQQHKKQKLFT